MCAIFDRPENHQFIPIGHQHTWWCFTVCSASLTFPDASWELLKCGSQKLFCCLKLNRIEWMGRHIGSWGGFTLNLWHMRSSSSVAGRAGIRRQRSTNPSCWCLEKILEILCGCSGWCLQRRGSVSQHDGSSSSSDGHRGVVSSPVPHVLVLHHAFVVHQTRRHSDGRGRGSQGRDFLTRHLCPCHAFKGPGATLCAESQGESKVKCNKRCCLQWSGGRMDMNSCRQEVMWDQLLTEDLKRCPVLELSWDGLGDGGQRAGTHRHTHTIYTIYTKIYIYI